jgi:uncharacterized protein
VQTTGKYSLLIFLLFVGLVRQAPAIPTDDLLKSLQPSADVNDFAGILSPAEKQALEARCRQLREQTGAQLAVVTLRSLNGGEIDDFTNKLFKRWGIGQKGKKNGLLLLVAIVEHKARIEVGYGLEPIIPDVLAGRIIDHQLRPQFRNQQYAAGLTAAVNELCVLVEKGEPADREALAQPERPLANQLSGILFLTVFVAAGALLLGTGLGLPQSGMALFGLVFGGVAMLAGFAIAGGLALVAHLTVGIACTALGWYFAKHGNGNWLSNGQQWGSSRSNWNWGDFSGSSGSGWSSGGGGFSQSWGGFGGGSSGGGGASGGW